MKKELERHNQTVLVIDGHPYSLVREINPTSNMVCSQCELRQYCKVDNVGLVFMPLCTPEGQGENWFFIEDWDIIQTPLVCYCTGDHSIAKSVSETKTHDD